MPSFRGVTTPMSMARYAATSWSRGRPEEDKFFRNIFFTFRLNFSKLFERQNEKMQQNPTVSLEDDGDPRFLAKVLVDGLSDGQTLVLGKRRR